MNGQIEIQMPEARMSWWKRITDWLNSAFLALDYDPYEDSNSRFRAIHDEIEKLQLRVAQLESAQQKDTADKCV